MNSEQTPHPVFDRGTGYLVLTDGVSRQVWCRVVNGEFLVMFRKDKKEYPVTLNEILAAYNDSFEEPESQ